MWKIRTNENVTEKEFHKPKECVSDDDECEG